MLELKFLLPFVNDRIFAVQRSCHYIGKLYALNLKNSLFYVAMLLNELLLNVVFCNVFVGSLQYKPITNFKM